MKLKLYSLIILILSINVIYAQVDKKTVLDYLNEELEEFPFETEKNINGLFFITLSDSMNYYDKSIVVDDQHGNALLKIDVEESNTLTTFKNLTYQQNDINNPVDPWLLGLNPDYFRLAFECVEETEDCYIVEINKTELGYIKKDNSDFQKQSHEEFIKGWTSLGVDFDRSKNPLLKNINSQEKIPNPNKGKYKIWRAEFIEMKGDWMKVETFENEIGWIR